MSRPDSGPRFVPVGESLQVRNLLALAEDRHVPVCWSEWLRRNADSKLIDEEVAAISELRADIARGIDRTWEAVDG